MKCFDCGQEMRKCDICEDCSHSKSDSPVCEKCGVSKQFSVDGWFCWECNRYKYDNGEDIDYSAGLEMETQNSEQEARR